MTIISRKNTALFVHIGVWSFLFFLPHLFTSSDSRNVRPGFFPSSFFIITNLFHIGLFYFNVFVLYPLFFNRRKWYIFIALCAAIIAVSYYLKLFITRAWYPDVILDEWAHRILFFPTFAFLFISTIYRLSYDKIQYDKKQKEIAAEQLSIKLKFLHQWYMMEKA